MLEDTYSLSCLASLFLGDEIVHQNETNTEAENKAKYAMFLADFHSSVSSIVLEESGRYVDLLSGGREHVLCLLRSRVERAHGECFVLLPPFTG